MSAQEKASLSDLEDAVLAQIMEDEIVRFHAGLVNIKSINPPGDCRDAIDYVERPLERAGFSTSRFGDLDIMPNLVARLGDAAGVTLLLNAHVDVVPIGERSAWTHEPFGAELHDGRVYGRGAGDDKASVTAQVIASLAVQRAGIPLAGELVYTAVSDEEVGGIHGAKLLADEIELPDWAIVGEQTLNKVCVGEKGGAGLRLIIRGKTAHGALPWEGVNALEAAAEVIVALRKELWPELGDRTHWAFHPSSGSVNMIKAGVKENVVPDFAEIYVDRRTVPSEDVDDVRQEVLAIAARALESVPGATIELGESFPGMNATASEVSDPLVQSMIGANQRLGLSTEPTGFSMATDGRFWAAKGVPTIIYGPGDPSLAHKPDEWVGVEEMVDAARAYAIAIVRLIGDYERRDDNV